MGHSLPVPARDLPPIIVGAGPVGLTMACELRRHGVPARVVDREPAPTDQSRALGLHARTLEIFERLGIAERVLAVGQPTGRFTLHSQRGPLAAIAFDHLETRYPYVLFLPQCETERVLTERLFELGGSVERGVELVSAAEATPGIVATTLRHADGRIECASTPWLIGCDGVRSSVRSAMGVPFDGGRYDETFVLADLLLRSSLARDDARAILHPDGAMAIFPLGGPRGCDPLLAAGTGWYRVVAANAERRGGHGGRRGGDSETPSLLDHGFQNTAPTLEEVRELLAARGPHDMEILEDIWRSRFRISHRVARRWRRGRMFLAGDAAHVHSPIGGQGMNIGIQDAHNLAWKLALVECGHARESLLDTYERERRPIACGVVALTDRATRLVTVRNRLLQTARDAIVRRVARLEPISRRMAERISGLGHAYRRSDIADQRWRGTDGVPAGRRAPDAALVDGRDGQPIRLAHVFSQPRHVLLAFTKGDESSAELESVLALATTLEREFAGLVKTVLIVGQQPSATAAAHATRVLVDTHGHAIGRYAASPTALYLVRPDGVVGYRSRPPDGAALLAHLRRTLIARSSAGRQA